MTAYKEKLKAPFPYFGGKAAVAAEVWRRFGRVDNYVESFFGSGAVLLGNPWWAPECRLVETVNDRDCYIANFWRALRATPEQLAEIVDNPINECDLEAWHKWLVAASRRGISMLISGGLNPPCWRLVHEARYLCGGDDAG